MQALPDDLVFQRVGTTATRLYGFYNEGTSPVANFKVWLAPDVNEAKVSLSYNGQDWVSPTSPEDPDVICWAQIKVGATVLLHVKHITNPDELSSQTVFDRVRFAWG